MGVPMIFLDPEEVAVASRTQIPLTEGIKPFYEGIDWGDQEITAFKSEGVFGSSPIDHVWPLRAIHIPLVIEARGNRSFDESRRLLQQWVAAVNQEGGGWIKRVLHSGSHYFADIVEAKLHLSSDWLTENRDLDRSATLELWAKPDFYGDKIVGSAHEFTGDGSFTEVIGGDMPARVENMQIEDLSGNNQNGLLFHYRGRHYSSANTAEWAYNAEALGVLDIAEKVTLAGSYGTKVVKHPKLSTGWTPVLATNKAGTTFLTHTGLYNVWARVYSTSEKLPWLRLVYGVGDVVAPAENNQIQVPGKEGFFYVPLGQVNIAALPFGAQRWEGVIQARGEAGGENISIDRLLFECADECSGVLAARRSTTSLTTVDANDSLKGSGALTGSEANAGGKWEGSGDATDFTRTEEGAKRESVSDTNGRTALLSGSTIGPCTVSLETEATNASVSSAALTQGVYLRYSSSTYWVRVVRVTNEISVEYQAGGSVIKDSWFFTAPNPCPIVATIDRRGVVTVEEPFGGSLAPVTLPATFATGEAHGEGKIGIFDRNTAATEHVRRYRLLFAAPPSPADAVIYAGRSAYLSTLGNYRQSEDGLGASPVGFPGSDLPRLPISGPDSSPIEIAIKPSRGQMGEVADSGKDKFKVQVTYRPCFAEIPSS